MDVCSGDYATVHTVRWIVAEYGRIDSANHQAASIRMSASKNAGRGHKFIRSDSERMESRADSFRVGRSTSSKESEKSAAKTGIGRVRGVCKSSNPVANADHSAMATFMSNDPLVA